MRDIEEDGRCVVLNLSPEVIRRVFCQLDCIDLIHCSLVSRNTSPLHPFTLGFASLGCILGDCWQWYADSTELRESWKAEYMDACTVRGFRILRENNPPARVDAYISGVLD